MTRDHFFCFFGFLVFLFFFEVFWLFAICSHLYGALLFFSIAQKSYANQYDSQSLFIAKRCARPETSTVHKKRRGGNDVGQRSALRELVQQFCPYKGYKALLYMCSRTTLLSLQEVQSTSLNVLLYDTSVPRGGTKHSSKGALVRRFCRYKWYRARL